MPYAIGAKFAHPDRPAIALVGDGAMQMNGLAELMTAARYHRQWSDPRLIVCVFHNNDLNQVTWELRAMGGFPKFEESQALPDVSYADIARCMGLNAIAGFAPLFGLRIQWVAFIAAMVPALCILARQRRLGITLRSALRALKGSMSQVEESPHRATPIRLGGAIFAATVIQALPYFSFSGGRP